MSKTDRRILAASILEIGEHITALINAGQYDRAELTLETMRERVERFEKS